MRYFHKIAKEMNVAPLLAAVSRNPELWNQHRIRTTHDNSAHVQASDILLRFNDLSNFKDSDDYSVILNDLEAIDYPAFKELPQARGIIFDLMRFVEGKRLGRVVITKLTPGSKVTPHIDSGLSAEYYDRYHITLKNSEGSIFRVGDEVVCMEPGDIYLFNNQVEHEVINNGTDDRITLIVDIRSK